MVEHFREAVLPLPHRDIKEAKVVWRPATFAPVHRILTNPIYAGTYAYGRSKTERRLDEQGRVRTRQVLRPVEQWEVVIENHHPGFISFETYLSNRRRLRDNWRAPKGEAAARSGNARHCCRASCCGRCGRRMQVTYSGTRGNVRRYSCHQAKRLQAAERTCQSLGGVRLDQRVVDV